MKESLDKEGLEAILPHRNRALMIDRVEIENGKPVGYYTVTPEVCEGHFPDMPILRGVDRTEMIGIMLGIAALRSGIIHIPEGHWPVLTDTGRSSYRGYVYPGDEVRLEVDLTKETRKFIEGNGKAFVGENVVAEVEGIKIFVVPKPEPLNF